MRPSHKKENAWIWGEHAVEACLECHPELVIQLYFEKGKSTPLLEAAKKAKLKVIEVPMLPKSLADKRHQGVAAEIRYFPIQSLPWLLDEWQKPDAFSLPTQWAFLDGVEDPRNFGAILRSAAAFGVKAVIVRNKHQASLSGLVAQASAGAAFRIPIVEISQVSQFFREVENFQQVQTIALDGGGRDLISILKTAKETDARAFLWVLGAEGEGLQAEILKKCHYRGRIEMDNAIESLNVSVAAALAFYLGRQGSG